MVDENEIVQSVRDGGAALASLVDARFSTRAEFARVAGISPSDASRFCNGARAPGPLAIRRMLTAFGVTRPVEQCIADESPLMRTLQRSLAEERERARRLEDDNARLRSENQQLRSVLVKARSALDKA